MTGKSFLIFEKVAKTVAAPKNAKMSALKLILKVQNINIKQRLKPKNTHSKPCFETPYLDKKKLNCLNNK